MNEQQTILGCSSLKLSASSSSTSEKSMKCKQTKFCNIALSHGVCLYTYELHYYGVSIKSAISGNLACLLLQLIGWEILKCQSWVKLLEMKC